MIRYPSTKVRDFGACWTNTVGKECRRLTVHPHIREQPLGAPLPDPTLARPLRSVVVYMLPHERSKPQLIGEDPVDLGACFRFFLAAFALLAMSISSEELEDKELGADSRVVVKVLSLRGPAGLMAAGAETTLRRPVEIFLRDNERSKVAVENGVSGAERLDEEGVTKESESLLEPKAIMTDCVCMRC